MGQVRVRVKGNRLENRRWQQGGGCDRNVYNIKVARFTAVRSPTPLAPLVTYVARYEVLHPCHASGQQNPVTIPNFEIDSDTLLGRPCQIGLP